MMVDCHLYLVNDDDVHVIPVMHIDSAFESELSCLSATELANLRHTFGLYSISGIPVLLERGEAKTIVDEMGFKKKPKTIRCKSVEDAMRLSASKARPGLIYIYRDEGLWERWEAIPSKKKYVFVGMCVISSHIRRDMALPKLTTKKLEKFYGEGICVLER